MKRRGRADSRRNRRLRFRLRPGRTAGLAVCALLFIGCERDLSDLERYRDEVLSRPAGVIAPLPTLTSQRSESVTRVFGRDVFALLDTGKARPRGERLASPGCEPRGRPAPSAAINDLSYLSTAATPSERYAILADANGTLYRISVGDRIGLGCVLVTGIEPEGVALQTLLGESLELKRKTESD